MRSKLRVIARDDSRNDETDRALPAPKVSETDLYTPVKRLLEQQGYEVKGEIGAADVVALRGDEPPVIVELKTGFSLSLFHQAVERLRISDAVYIAVPQAPGGRFAASVADNLILCRRLGLGLITVDCRRWIATALADPGSYRPRKSAVKTNRLLLEFARRVGDPNSGGATRKGLITTYRQDALRCLNHLHAHGPTKASIVAKETLVTTARRIMADDHYGWFRRVRTGVYAITPKGLEAVDLYRCELSRLAA
ncbi:hypothetical protein GC169_07400 [bacterium]|nr:hypothetical protein [bacterium]